MTETPRRGLAAIALLLLLAPRLSAQPATAGVAVATTHVADELNPSVVADGLGGAYVGFKLPYRSASLPAEIVVSHVLPSGAPHPDWQALPMTPAGSLLQANTGPARVLAPSGEVLAFADLTNGTGTVDLTRKVGESGADPSYPGFKPTYPYLVFTALPRTDGGALILSKAQGGLINCLATVVSPTGTGTEVFNTIDIGNGTYASVGNDRMAAVPSGVNGAIVVIQLPQVFNTLTGTDLVAVRIDATGNAVWGPVHRLLSAAARDQTDPAATSDDADGLIVAWRDGRNTATGSDIYAQRLLSNGTVATGWTAGGKAICTASGPQTAPAIAPDGAGGAWFAWVDGRDTTGTDIYYTHVLANGTIAVGYPAGGKALCAAPGSQTSVQLARDGSGGCFAVWLDPRDGEVDLYGEHFDFAGNATAGWIANGSALCTDPTAQASPAIDIVSPGRAIVAWSDSRLGSQAVFALVLDATHGALDAPPARIARLALAARANPARGALELSVDAAEAGEVHVALYDVGGRILAKRTVAGPARAADVRFDRLSPGLYFAVAGQRGAIASTRVAVVR